MKLFKNPFKSKKSTNKLITRYVPLSNQILAHATINKPKTLNSIDLDIINSLYHKLLEWKEDKSIAMVLLDAEGEKAFCAGGDVVSLYHAIKEDPETNKEQLVAFFSKEYRLNHLMHTYPKPILCWGHGYVMGGGKGLFAGCSHRVVTERSIIAMPEVTIGLFPDVGGSWFLQRMSKPLGLFVGITGARINATDALYLNLADRFIEHHKKTSIVKRIVNAQGWSQNFKNNHQLLSQILKAAEGKRQILPQSDLLENILLINQACDAPNIEQVAANIAAIETDNKWLSHAIGNMTKGAPLTIKLVDQQMQRSRFLSLREIFQMELDLAMNCCLRGEFVEGVRALLVDKDNKPNWQHPSLNDIDDEFVDSFFEYNWQDKHPLGDL